MLTAELINNNIPRLQLDDTVVKARQLMADFRVTHLPVVTDGFYMGLVSDEDLDDAEGDQKSIRLFEGNFIDASVFEHDHFLIAVNRSNQFETSVVPVLNKERAYMGVITAPELLRTLGHFTGAQEQGSIIIIEMERSQFSISEISRIVESNDATILHLNTNLHPVTGILTVTLHLNKKETAPIIASFERYEYTVTYFFGDDAIGKEIDGNYHHLMNYLSL